jgi:hypothetical protein
VNERPATGDKYEQIAATIPRFDDEQLTLRQLAKRDPVRGAPRDCGVRNEAGEVVWIEPGQWRALADDITDLPPDCPVVALGSDGDKFFFLNTVGHVHMLKDNAGKGPIDALFQGRGRFVEWAWPRLAAPKKKNDPWTVKGYEAEEARVALFAACAYKGTFELEDRVRGRGAWRDDDGTLIYHAGDKVMIGGKWEPCGEHGRHIYPARPKIGRPEPVYQQAGEGSPGDYLLKLLETWNWERKAVDPRLMLGWLVTAMIGGALTQRPVVFLNGQEGSGKSTLQAMLRLTMNGALLSSSNTTQAGIYQRVRQDSVAIFVDELEAKDDTRVVDKILELARIAYSGDKMQRGGKDGDGKEFALMSSFMGSSIAKPAMDAQDESRMALLLLRPRVGVEAKEFAADSITPKMINAWFKTAGHDSPVDGTKLALIGRQLLRRAFDWFPRWDGLRNVFRQALKAAGHSDRSADTFGALAAACHVALGDDLPTAEDMAQWCAWLKPSELAETATQEASWRRCFTHMLLAQPEVLRQQAGKVRSIGDALERFRADAAGDLDAIAVAKLNGLALSWPKGETQLFENARLFVPAKHPALHSLFAGTPWAGRLGAPGPWIGVLRQMPVELFHNGKGEGLDGKASGMFIHLAKALEA